MRVKDFQITGEYGSRAKMSEVCKRLGRIGLLYCTFAASATFIVFLYYETQIVFRDSPYAPIWCAQLSLLLGLCTLILLNEGFRRTMPFFSAYALAELCSSLVSPTGVTPFIWIVFFATVVLKCLAVGELFALFLREYRGIWALAWRLLLSSAVTAVLLESLIGPHKPTYIALILSRGINLAIALTVTCLFLFVRYYAIPTRPGLSRLAMGFLIFSCFAVLNDAVMVRLLSKYASYWRLLDALAFIATLILWCSALPGQLLKQKDEPSNIAPEMSAGLTPPVNIYTPTLSTRLDHLNERLSVFWKVEHPRS